MLRITIFIYALLVYLPFSADCGSVDSPKRALELAYAYTGFEEIHAAAEAGNFHGVRLTTYTDSTILLLFEKVRGKTMWEVTADSVYLNLPRIKPETLAKYNPKSYIVVIDSISGSLIEVQSKYLDSVSQFPLESWRSRVNVSKRDFLGFVDEPPPTSLMDALNEAIGSCHLHGVLTVAVLAMHPRDNETRPVWHVIGLGGGRFQVRGGGGHAPRPVTKKGVARYSQMKRCSHNLIDAATGEGFGGISSGPGPRALLDSLIPVVEYRPVTTAKQAVEVALRYSGFAFETERVKQLEDSAEKIALFQDSAKIPAWRVHFSDVTLVSSDSQSFCRTYEFFLDSASSNLLIARSRSSEDSSCFPMTGPAAEQYPLLKPGYGLVSHSGIMSFRDAVHHLNFDFSEAGTFEVSLYFVHPDQHYPELLPVWNISGRVRSSPTSDAPKPEAVSDVDWCLYKEGYRGYRHMIDARTGVGRWGQRQI